MNNNIKHILQQTKDVAWQKWLVTKSRLPSSDVRRMLTKDALDSDFALLCQPAGKPVDNSTVAALFRLVA